MAQYAFGAGVMWATPQQDASGAAIANPTPVIFGTMQEGSIDISWEGKSLYGQLQFPVAFGRGKGKISGKAKVAQINGAVYNSVILGQTLSNGIDTIQYDTAGANIPASPYAITPTVPNSGTWTQDLGVIDSNGLPMTRVASAPATGQYMVAAGVYTFAAADTTKKVFISYAYTATSTTAKKSTVINLPMGYAPSFQLDLYIPYAGKSTKIHLFNAIGNKLSFTTKQDDFMIPEFEFDGFADSSNQVFSYGTSE